MINNSEANLVSFKVLLTRKNEIVTEFSMLPEEMVDDVFPKEERELITTKVHKMMTKNLEMD